MLKVYLSSTFADLADYRKAVEDQLRRMEDVHVVAMEDYVASDERPLDKLESLLRLDRLILTMRATCGAGTSSVLLRKDHERKAWWEASCTHRRRKRRRLRLRAAAAVAVGAALSVGGVFGCRQVPRAGQPALLRMEASGTDPVVGLGALARLVADYGETPNGYLAPGGRPDVTRARDLFGPGLWSADGSGPAAEPAKIVKLLDSVPDSREVFGSKVWAAEELGYRDAAVRREAEIVNKRPVQRSAKKQSREPPKSDVDQELNPRIPIEGGRFRMGSSDEAHWVTVTDFEMQEHEVTNEEYWRFDGSRKPEEPAEEQRLQRLPVVKVNWHEAMAYATWLGGSLPTEVQWEFAARGPGEEPREYPWGDPPIEGAICGVFASCESYALAEVGSFPRGATPPPAVIYDLAGNAWEWCRDWYGDYRDAEEVDPVGPPTGRKRVLRGGSFRDDYPGTLRGATRGFNFPETRQELNGFRVVFESAGDRE